MAVKKEKYVYVFFNCDEKKSHASMNIEYNHEAFKDTKAAKQQLLDKVKSEVKSGRVQIEEANLANVEQAILSSDPTSANQYLHFAQIVPFLCH
jgi:hypothetical protein